jgi:hypothetical protein
VGNLNKNLKIWVLKVQKCVYIPIWEAWFYHYESIENRFSVGKINAFEVPVQIKESVFLYY